MGCSVFLKFDTSELPFLTFPAIKNIFSPYYSSYWSPSTGPGSKSLFKPHTLTCLNSSSSSALTLACSRRRPFMRSSVSSSCIVFSEKLALKVLFCDNFEANDRGRLLRRDRCSLVLELSDPLRLRLLAIELTLPDAPRDLPWAESLSARPWTPSAPPKVRVSSGFRMMFYGSCGYAA